MKRVASGTRGGDTFIENLNQPCKFWRARFRSMHMVILFKLSRKFVSTSQSRCARKAGTRGPTTIGRSQQWLRCSVWTCAQTFLARSSALFPGVDAKPVNEKVNNSI